MPVHLELAGVKGAGCECLLCGRETEPPRDSFGPLSGIQDPLPDDAGGAI
ncbi:MAG: hypothetical protein ACOX33_02690 [Dethiobacteria bacterium]